MNLNIDSTLAGKQVLQAKQCIYVTMIERSK